MKALLTTILLTGFITICSTNNYAQVKANTPFSLIRVYENPSRQSITAAWNDDRIDEVEIQTANGVFMPSIPVFNAREIHLDKLEDGTYYLIFNSKGEMLHSKMIIVENSNMISKI